jgi:hypothetical protein
MQDHHRFQVPRAPPDRHPATLTGDFGRPDSSCPQTIFELNLSGSGEGNKEGMTALQDSHSSNGRSRTRGAGGAQLPETRQDNGSKKKQFLASARDFGALVLAIEWESQLRRRRREHASSNPVPGGVNHLHSLALFGRGLLH